MLLGLFPGWVPTEPLFVGTLALIVAALVLNRGKWWMINVLATDEPLVVAIGVTIAAGSGWLSQTIGAADQETWFVVGVAIAVLGVIVWWSDDLDISGLV